MDVNSGESPKRSRAKAATTATLKAAAPAKKPRGSSKSATKSKAPHSESAAVVAPDSTQPTDAALAGMIATAAYFIAAERNFSPGHELDDWLEAERRIRTAYFE